MEQKQDIPAENKIQENLENTKIKNFTVLFDNLIVICERIVKKAIESKMFVSKKDKEISLKNLSKSISDYKKCFAYTNDNEKELKQLGIFKHMLDNNINIMNCMIDDTDDWIFDKDIKLHFGINLGKPVNIILNLSDIYDISIKIKEAHEKNMKEFPDSFNADETLKYPLFIIFFMYKIFALCTDQDFIKKCISTQERKLGIGQQNQRKMPDISAIADIGIDMFAKFQETNTDGKKLDPAVMKAALNNTFNSNGMQNFMNNIQNMGNTSGGKAPDMADIFKSLFQNLNPASLMETMQNAVNSAVPAAGTPTGGTPGLNPAEEKKEEKKEVPTIEEIKEHVEEYEEVEIIEEEI
jgi:ribosomal protein L12E/L44/L45/RPP1/RPP2